MNLSQALSVLALALFCTTMATASDQPDNYDWPTYARDPGSSKYAPLDQINRETVENLKVAWSWSAPDNAYLEGSNQFASSGFKSTPIKIGNTLYISTPMGFAAAIDAETGAQKWVFDTHTYEHGQPANIGFNHRGVAYYEQAGKRRILMGTNNAFLWSLDADTGIPDRSFGTEGRIDLTVGLGKEIRRSLYSSVAAPMIVGDTVILGAVISDMPLLEWYTRFQDDMPPGHVRGFDVHTGRQNWIFHSIPQEGETGNETWENDSWKVTGSTNVWTLMSADPELGYVYLPFGAPSNDWYGGQRLGDNLFGNSIVCLDAKTGELVWHFQTIHHDLWDYDLPAAPNLVDIEVDGKKIKALAQVTKQAFLFVLNRVTGEPVWPIVERAVPGSDVPGERASATQPFPTRPAAFDLQGLAEEDLINFTPELRNEAKRIISEFRNDGFYTPPSTRGSIQVPMDGGGAEWTGAAFDPKSSLLYVSSATGVVMSKLFEPEPGTTEFKYLRGGNRYLRGPKGLPLTKPPYSRISAINLNTGEYEWVVPNGDGIRQRIIDMGLADPGPVGAFGHISPLVTDSLLFVATYDNKSVLRALDKTTGVVLHEMELPARPMGAPMTYMVDGKQYIAVATMAGAKDARLIALRLP